MDAVCRAAPRRVGESIAVGLEGGGACQDGGEQADDTSWTTGAVQEMPSLTNHASRL